MMINCDNWQNAAEWVSMSFDPNLQVNIRPIIEHLTGRQTIILSADGWEDMKEQIADMLEQFVAMRRGK
jgi:hypothetical protein